VVDQILVVEGAEVREVPLHPRPDILVRIQFQTIRRQADDLEPHVGY